MSKREHAESGGVQHEELRPTVHFSVISRTPKDKSWRIFAFFSPSRIRIIVLVAFVICLSFRVRDSLHLLLRKGAAVYDTPIKLYSDASTKTEACSIPDACILSAYYKGDFKRAVYIPVEHSRYEKQLRRCMPSSYKIYFYNRNSPPEVLYRPIFERHNVDSVGIPIIDTYFSHFAHFGPDFYRYILLPASLFLSKQRTLKAECLSPNGYRSECSPNRVWPTTPRIIIGSDEFKTNWVTEFISMMSTGNRYLLKTKPYNASHAPPICVRTLITTSTNYDSRVELHDRLLRANGVSRALQPRQNGKCKLRVVVLLRAWTWRVARTIPDPARSQLQDAITRHLSLSKISSQVEVIIDLNAGRNLTEQIAVMQRADILVSVHGAELTNALFMRNGAVAVELSPFGFHSLYFDNVFNAARVSFVRMCSPPDPPEFRKCVSKKEVNTAAANSSVTEFTQLVKEYRRRNNTIRDMHDCRLHEFWSAVCARNQQIPINPEKVAALVAQRADSICGARPGTN